MRPIKLIMTAFGPYAGKEEIDFTKLGNKNIFLITGPTGAGKTTIFDGISYAIYGEASGNGRDGENLRSQFADSGILTSVEIYFKLKGLEYYIKRIPKQMKPKSRGEGLTEQKTDAEMKVFDKNKKFKVISGVSSVNEKVNEIMGINYQQFKQIMMIPQGQFRELLVSDSKDKEKILRKIFNTEIYSKFELRLSDMSVEIYKDIKLLNEKKLENINKIRCEKNSMLYNAINKEDKNYDDILKLLSEKINSDKKEDSLLNEKISNIDINIEGVQRKIYEAEENNKKLKEKSRIEEHLQFLHSQKNNINLKEKKLSKGKMALKLRPFEENYISRKKDLVIKQEQLETIKSKVKSAKCKLKVDEEKFEYENSREDYRNSIVEKVTKLKNYMQKITSLKSRKESLNDFETKIQKTKKNREDKKDSMENLKEKINDLKDNLDSSNNFGEKQVILESKLYKSDRIYNTIIDLRRENNEILKIRDKYKLYSKNMEYNKISYENEKKKLDRIENMFMKGQAAFMASSLKEGEACPVCGSIHHPFIAKMNYKCPTEKEIENQRNCLKSAEKAYEESREKFQNIDVEGRSKSKVIHRIKNDYKKLSGQNIDDIGKQTLTEFIDNKVKYLESYLNKIKVEIDRVKKNKIKVEEQKKELKNKVSIYDRENKLFDEINEEYSNEIVEIEKIRGILNQILSDVPEKYRNRHFLERSISKLEKEQSDAVKLFKKSQENYINSRTFYERFCADKNSVENDIQRVRSYVVGSKKIFIDKLKEMGFLDINDYDDSKISSEEEIKIENNINSFYKELKSSKDRYERLLLDIKNKSIENIDELKNIYNNMRNKRIEFEGKKSDLNTRLELNIVVLKRLLEIIEVIQCKEKRYSIVGELSEVSKGKNSERINFERYVLSAFFENIIDAANIRFRKMSEGRYELSRITESVKGRSQSGLDLQVYDNYTGKYRHVKTLSGGESFKAALSLSLGLADIVQCYSGGISLDTMFIDEGFGTLDSESLDSAIQCLIDLQSKGRLVGIISHVPELKERIDAKLEIIPSAEGSKTRFNII